MIYAATDADGTQVGLSFQIAIRETAPQVNGDAAPEKPGTPAVTRTTFSKPTNPALDVTWTAPASGATPTGYEAQYRKQAAEGEDPAEWTAYGGTLGATATSLKLKDLEAGATYEVQVRALNNDERGPWSDTGSGTANTPPVGTGVGWGARQLNRGAYGPSTSGVTDHFTDADGDTLTYSAAPPYPGLVNAWFVGAQLWLSTPNPTPTSGVNIAYRAHDPYGGVSDPSTVRITVVDNPTRSIAENAAAGTAVGDPVAGNPYDDGDDQTDDTLTHTLTGEAATSGAFEIDSATGQISVKQGASPSTTRPRAPTPARCSGPCRDRPCSPPSPSR